MFISLDDFSERGFFVRPTIAVPTATPQTTERIKPKGLAFNGRMKKPPKGAMTEQPNKTEPPPAMAEPSIQALPILNGSFNKKGIPPSEIPASPMIRLVIP